MDIMKCNIMWHIVYVRNNWRRAVELLENNAHPRWWCGHDAKRSGRYTSGVHYFLIIQRTEVNYSAYTTVATPQDTDQMIYFKAFVWFFYLNRYCE